MRRPLALVLAICTACFAASCSDDSSSKDARVRPEAGTESDGGGPATETTIFDINSGKVAEKTTVTLMDVIVTAVDGNGQYTGDVYVQDAKGGKGSGLKLYRPQRTDGGQITELQPGDHVKVEGVVKYFSPTSTPFEDGKKVIELDQGCQISRLAGGTAPTPAEVTAQDLSEETTAVGWSHVLVTVKNVAVTSKVDPEYGEFFISGGISVDDELFPASPKIEDCLSVTGIVFYFYSYKLAPRSAQDLTAGSGCPTAKQVTIKDLQDETSANHPADGSWIKTTGIISAVDTTPYDGKYTGFWIQMETGGPRSGIYVYDTWKSGSSDIPKLNDVVDLWGTYTEYQPSTKSPETISELSKVSFISKGPASKAPVGEVVNPADIATKGAKAEDYEGVLVKVENVSVGDYAMTTGTTPKKVGIILAGSNLYVESELFDFMGTTPPAVGDTYASITGVLQYAYSNFMIFPRSAADLMK